MWLFGSLNAALAQISTEGAWGLPPRLLSPGGVGVVPLSFLAVLPYPIFATSGIDPRLLSPGYVGVVPLSFLAVLPNLPLQRQGIASSVAEPRMCRGSPLRLSGCPWECEVTYPSNVRGLTPRLLSRGCVEVVPLSFLAVLPYPILATSGDCLLAPLRLSGCPWECEVTYPCNVRGLPPRLLSPGCVGVVPLSFLAVLPYPILATSGDCLLGC
ncbi:unnamed protein product [Nezara viridula]|uniref:Uncharacterized protein n=1 Tax=Nezara viridula TaxID=85310 RepID=A0A9P0H4Q7_NEZVI|nr:unnamed protein product [Nezara viridula]